ncbi:MAG: hypothetical protein ACYDGX_08185 [Thermoleophilia bacterium]
MKKKSVALAIVIVALFGSIAFAAVPHYWGSSSSNTSTQKSSDSRVSQQDKPASHEYGHDHDRRHGND